MAAASKTIVDASDLEIITTRIFDAPPELVWEAWTNPKHIAKWWGPDGFATVTHEHDLRPGGVWRHTMHGPDGAEYPNESRFIEVVRPLRLVFKHGGHRDGGGTPVCFMHTVTFEDLGGRTRVTARVAFETVEGRDAAVREYGAVEGARQHFANLADYLPHMADARAPGKHLRISREFDAPRALVWKMWTQPVLLQQWWGPQGYTLPHCTVDLRVGGTWMYCMRSPEGEDYWCAGTYMEIAEPERLVVTNYFCDAAGNLVTPVTMGMPEAMPSKFMLTITFVEHKGRTTVTINQAIPDAIARQLGAYTGWNQSLDKLVEALANR